MVGSQLQTEPFIRCQSKVAEVVSGDGPLEALEDAAIEDDPDWHWSMRIQAAPIQDLLDGE